MIVAVPSGATWGGDVVFESTLLESKMLHGVGASKARRFVGGAYAGPRAGSVAVAVAGAAGDATTTLSRLTKTLTEPVLPASMRRDV